MKNLLIRLFSFIICLALLAGGAILTFTMTMENPDLMKDWNDISEAEWLPGIKGEEQTPEGGDQSTEGGNQTTEGGDQTTESGDQTTEGGDQTTESGDQTTESGDQTTEGEGQNPEGNDPVTE